MAFANEVGLPARRQAAGRRRRAGDLPAGRRRRAVELARGASRRARTTPGLLEEFLVGEEHTFDSVTVGGRDGLGVGLRLPAAAAGGAAQPVDPVDRAAAPRDRAVRSTQGICEVGPAALRALGVRDALTHMEWFRRPDGSVAVSEVGARPPGAQISLDARLRPRRRLLPRSGPSWCCSAGSTHPSAGTPPARRTCAGRGAAGCAPCTASTKLQRELGHLVVEAEAAAARAAGVVELRGRGVRHRPRPGHRGGPGRAAPHRHRGPRRARGATQ